MSLKCFCYKKTLSYIKIIHMSRGDLGFNPSHGHLVARGVHSHEIGDIGHTGEFIQVTAAETLWIHYRGDPQQLISLMDGLGTVSKSGERQNITEDLIISILWLKLIL